MRSVELYDSPVNSMSYIWFIPDFQIGPYRPAKLKMQ